MSDLSDTVKSKVCTHGHVERICIITEHITRCMILMHHFDDAATMPAPYEVVPALKSLGNCGTPAWDVLLADYQVMRQ